MRAAAIARGGLVGLVGLALAGRSAQADRYEASIAGELHGGIARINEPGTETLSAPAFGARARVTHAWRDRLAWDVQLAAAITQPVTFVDVERNVGGRPQRGDVTRRTVTTSAQLGAELRLGVRLLPTLRVALGPQVRHRTASDLGALIEAVPAETSLDALASVGLGVDLRLGRHLAIGLALTWDHAQPLGDAGALDVIGVSIRVSRFWYPHWWEPAW